MSQRIVHSFFLPFMPKPLNTMTIRYEFLITTPGMFRRYEGGGGSGSNKPTFRPP